MPAEKVDRKSNKIVISKRTTTMMELNRNFVLTSIHGHSVRFQKDVPTHVPNMIVREAVAIGAQRVDREPAIKAEPVGKNVAPQNPAERIEAVIVAMEIILARKDREDFTGTGHPTVKALSQEAGFRIDKTELNKVWQERAERLVLEQRDGTN